MSNSFKKVKIAFIAGICAVIASCSSGGTGTIEGLNISGTFNGTVSSGSVIYNVQVDFAQTSSVGLTGSAATSPVSFSISVTSISGGSVLLQSCVGATVSGGTLTIDSSSEPATLIGDGFTAVVPNNDQVTGQAVFDDFEDIDVGGVTVECDFGGPLIVNR